MGVILKVLLVLGLLYLLLALTVAAVQDRLIFPVGSVPAPGPVPAESRRLVVRTPDGVELRGLHIPPRQRSGERVLVLVFGGNAWNAEDAADLLHHDWPQVDVIAFHYRGYSPSGGKPSARALLADAFLVLAAARQTVPADRVFAVGMSVGSGVAASLAGRGQVDGALLVTPFDRLSSLVSDHFRWLPVASLLRHEMNSAAALRSSPAPVAIIAAGNDRIIPEQRTAALRRAVPRLVFDRTIPGAGHDDLYARHDFHSAMDEALAALLREPPLSPRPTGSPDRIRAEGGR